MNKSFIKYTQIYMIPLFLAPGSQTVQLMDKKVHLIYKLEKNNHHAFEVKSDWGFKTSKCFHTAKDTNQTPKG